VLVGRRIHEEKACEMDVRKLCQWQRWVIARSPAELLQDLTNFSLVAGHDLGHHRNG
jgi:hypothetical protein